ncbi:beta-lactamase [Pseudomonas syringae pv. spinaceae]|uniref:Beta-lactamase n=1 Tax=Pseudomonas syringae pv. spinaceae TaxID=264459 RepID=A0A0Q0BC40_PSESX|nr:beta-lactamase [Pseudomonas syringae pv. spinaceae]
MRGGVNAQWQADEHAEQNRQRGQFQGRREHPHDVVDHRVPGEQGFAQVAVQQVAEVHHELGGQWFVQAQFLIRLSVGGCIGVRADDG